MVDEPVGSARPNDAGTVDRPASPYEAEWKDGLGRLMSSFDNEIGRAVEAARRQATEAFRDIERDGLDLFKTLDTRQREAEERVVEVQATIQAAEEELRQRRATAEREAAQTTEQARRRADALIADAEERQRQAEADQAAIQERVAQIQATIEAAEDELSQSRAQAEREAAELIASARRRADQIIARAEDHAEEIVAEARAEAASRGGGADARTASGRLRGLAERVGLLLTTPGAAAGAGAAAAGGATSLAAAAPPAEAPSRPGEPVEPEEAPEPPAPVTAHDEGAEENAVDDESPTVGMHAAPTSRGPAPPPEMMRSWSRPSEAADEDEHDAEAATASTPGAPPWPTPAEQRSSASAQEPESPVFVRRVPDPEAVSVDDHADEPEPEPAAPAAISATPTAPEIPEPVAGPTGTVTQTLIFQSVPNFQAALALERSLKALSEVREVRVADFDERQLTFQVTHELGAQLPRVLLTQRAGELEFVEAKPERVEFVFRS